MENNFEAFVSTTPFVELQFEDLHSIISSDDLQVASEESVFKAIERWIEADVHKDREDKLEDLLKCVRWDQTSADFLTRLLKNHEFIQKHSGCLNYLLNVSAREDGCFNPNPRSRRSRNILIFGQPASGERIWIAESYDPATKQSKTLAHLDFRESAPVVQVCGEEVMIVGGWVNDKVSATVEVFSCREKQSRPVASLNIARGGHGACAVGDTVVVCGGLDGKLNFIDSCEVFSGDRWRLLPKMKEARWGVAVISSPDRRVFAIGGQAIAEESLSSLDFCRLPVDFASMQPTSEVFWRSLASMREARNVPAAVLFEGNIFVAGGFKGSIHNLSSVEIFSITEENAQWVSLPVPLKEQRFIFNLVVVSEELFAFGNGKSPHNTMELLQLSRKQNSTTSSSMNSFSGDLSSSQWKTLSPISSMKAVFGAVVIPRALS